MIHKNNHNALNIYIRVKSMIFGFMKLNVNFASELNLYFHYGMRFCNCNAVLSRAFYDKIIDFYEMTRKNRCQYIDAPCEEKHNSGRYEH